MFSLTDHHADIVVKDSGITWLGKVPSSWSIQPLKHLASISTGNRDTIEKDPNGEYPFFVRSEKIERIASYSYDGEAVLIPGDGNVGSIFHHYIGKYDCHQRVYNLTDFSQVSGRFVYYYMSACFKYEVDKGTAKSTVESLRLPMLMNFPVCFGSLGEQEKIMSILDGKCHTIDEIIRLQSLLVDALKNSKQSIISETVTKGLDPDVPMKDSGIRWAGSIPENWNIVPIKSRFKINKRIAGKLGFDVLSVTQDGVKIKDISSNDGQLSSDYSKYQLVYKGDFVMNHMDLLTGFVDCSPYDGVTSPDYRVFTLDSDDLCPRYALYILQMGYRNRIFYGMGQGVSSLGRWRLPKEQFLNFEFPLPPLDVQDSIVSYLDSKCKVIDSLISDYSESISKLNEFKQSFIYEYVTGKRSVPEEAIL